MGKRGLRPKPAALHKIGGYYRASRHGGEPEAPGELISPPAWLDRRQRRRFAELLRLSPKNILRPVDSTVLRAEVLKIEWCWKARATKRRRAPPKTAPVFSK